MPSTYTSDETQYEQNQRFNFLVSWLHSFRYKHILALFSKLSHATPGKAIKVVEIGCAHAKLFPLLNERFEIDYTGIEVALHSLETARQRYSGYPNFRIIHDSAANALAELSDADIIIALETFEHIPEHDVVRIIESIATIRPTYLVCSVPVEIGPSIWLKNIGSLLTGYVRHKDYRWSETFWAGLYQLDKLPPHGTKHKGFDWRWLAQTVRHNMKIRACKKFPFGFLPAAFAFSIFIVAEPRRNDQ